MPTLLWRCVLALALAVGCDGKEPPRPVRAPGAPKGAAAPPASQTPRDLETRELVVVLLGTGTPIPDPLRAGPSTAIVVDGRAYLVDAGPGVVRQAEAARRAGVGGLDPAQLDRLLLTHLHSDHTLGAPDVMRAPAVIGRAEPLQAYGPRGTAAMFEALEQAYVEDARIRRAAEGLGAGAAVNALDIEPGWVLREGRLTVRALGVDHGLFEHALGYHFEAAGRRVVVSGDTAPSEAIVAACDGCDVLVHEVYCEAGLQRLDPSVQRYHRRFHTSAPELAKLARRARPRLLVLTHLLPFGCSPLQLLDEVRAGYAGEVVVGEDLRVY